MRIFHLADLHIGKVVNGFSMLEEQGRVFTQVLQYIDQYAPQVVIIAGDVYDKTVPSVEAIRMFDEFLTSLSAKDVAVLIVAGNHDSPERLSFGSILFEDNRIYVNGGFSEKIRKVKLIDDLGEVSFWLLPFLKQSQLRAYSEKSALESNEAALVQLVNESGVNYNERNILVAHQFFICEGANEPSFSDSEINTVGSLEALKINQLDRFDYIALGHLHRSQRVGSDHIRYAGSPLKYSASEWQHHKSLTMIDLLDKENLSIFELPLEPLRDMREVKGKFANIIAEALDDDYSADYIHVVLTDEIAIVDAMNRLRQVFPNVMSLDYDNDAMKKRSFTNEVTAEKVKLMTITELFTSFFKDALGKEMNSMQKEIVQQLGDKEEQQ